MKKPLGTCYSLFLINSFDFDFLEFLAPTGAQGVTIFVRPCGSNLSRAVNLHHSGSNLQAIRQE